MQQIHVEQEREGAVVSASGELDAFTAPALEDVLAQVNAEDRGLVMDLSRVSFMDSTALGLVVRAVNSVTDRGRQARVVLPDTAARRIFEITTLDRILPVATSRDEALSELSALGTERQSPDPALGD